MKKTCAIGAGIVSVIVLLLTPATASANTFLLTCEPAAEAAPPQWFGGQWQGPLTVRVDTDAKAIQLVDQAGNAIADTVHAARLASLGGYEMDVTINESVIVWGVARMWGVSGYVDRASGRIDVLWATPNGYSPDTLIRQFHGTCHER